MPALKQITFDAFDGGLDLRKGASVADANRMRELTNAFVTTGKALRKRPALTKVATLEAGTKGLVAGLGKLNTFYESGTITHADSLFESNKVPHPTTTQLVTKVHHGDVFLGYVYASIEYADASIWHHYMDGSFHITDANCPQSASWIKTTNKIWAVNGETVRFCATNLPRDWSLADDAGFLPTGLQQTGATDAMALGLHDRDLVAFFSDSAQAWGPDPDPALHVFLKSIPGVGCRYPRTVQAVSDDLYFLSDAGYRSIVVNRATDNKTDLDVGNPIDKLVVPLLTGGVDPLSQYYAGGGQYWGMIGNRAFVYTYSRSAKLNSWSDYELPFTPDDTAELDGVFYLRAGDDVYKADPSVFADDGVNYPVTIELPFLDFKKKGMLKQIVGIDAVMTGSCDFAMRWDPRDTSLITSSVPLSGDTYAGAMTGFECVSTAFAPVITVNNAEEFQLDALTIYYKELGVK